MNITKIDHIVLTVKDIERTIQFYESILNITAESFHNGRKFLVFGDQKINLHECSNEFEPKANYPTPGSADMCFLISSSLKEAMEHVTSKGIEIIEGPVSRAGATGPIVSFYFRDPDHNLIEIAKPETSHFCTAINCMDGRTQLPVISFLKKRFNAEYVDTITEPGPNKILAENKKKSLVNSIFDRLRISVEKHNSRGIAVIGHFDCAGNPTDKDDQIEHLQKAIILIKKRFKGIEVIALWVDENFEVTEL